MDSFNVRHRHFRVTQTAERRHAVEALRLRTRPIKAASTRRGRDRSYRIAKHLRSFRKTSSAYEPRGSSLNWDRRRSPKSDLIRKSGNVETTEDDFPAGLCADCWLDRGERSVLSKDAMASMPARPPRLKATNEISQASLNNLFGHLDRLPKLAKRHTVLQGQAGSPPNSRATTTVSDPARENIGELRSTALLPKSLTLLWSSNSGEQWRTVYWRKGWDSNPRYPCGHAGFQDRCLKPLGHPSKPGMAVA